MTRSLLLFLAVLVCALALGGLWYFAGDDATSNELPLVALGRSDAHTGAEGGGTLAAPKRDPKREDADDGPSTRAEVEEAADEPLDTAPVPSNAIWIEGRVVEPDGLPPGDELWVVARGRAFSRKSDRREHKVRVQPDGTFRVAVAQRTIIGWLRAESRFAYMEENYKLRPRDLEEEIVLEPVLGGVLRGEVVVPLQPSWAGRPLDGAFAELISFRGGIDARREDLDASGAFEFRALPPGELQGMLSVHTDRMQRGTVADPVEIEPGRVTDVRIELKPGARIFGTLLDDGGDVVSNAKIELDVREDQDGNGFSWSDRQKLTADDIDERGRFEFYGVKPGYVTLEATAPGYRDARADLGRISDGEERTGVALVLDGGRSIAGRVRWPDGDPAVGADVRVEQENDDEWRFWEQLAAVETDEDGDFELTGLTVDGACRVVATLRPSLERAGGNDDADGESEGAERRRLAPRPHVWRARQDGVLPGTKGLDLVLDSGAAVTGRVVDDRGEAVTRFHVTATPVDREFSRIDWETRVGTTMLMGDGSFELEGVQEGEWNLVVAAHGHVQSKPIRFRIPHDGTELLAVCPRAAEIHGLVRDPAGDPIDGADVEVRLRESDSEPRMGAAPGLLEARNFMDGGRVGGDRTDSNGAFQVEDLVSGDLIVEASHDGFASSGPTQVTIRPGELLEGVELRLRPGARLRIELHPGAGELAGRRVTLNRADGDYYETHRTDAGGTIVVDGLDAGTYTAHLQAPEALDGEPSELREAHSSRSEVSLRAGGSEVLVLGTPPAAVIRISGRVTRGGDAVPGIVVACRREGDRANHAFAAKTDGSGAYEFHVDAAGEFVFELTSGEDEVYYRREVAGESVVLDFALPTMFVEGVVTGPSGDPLDDVSVVLERVRRDDDPPGTTYQPRRTETEEDGGYRFEAVAPGAYRLRVASESGWGWRRRGPSYAQSVVDGIVVEDGRSQSGVDVRLERPGTVRGVVLGPDGEPAAGAIVQAKDTHGTAIASDGTSIDGRFRLTGLPPGSVRVEAMSEDLRSDTVEAKVYVDEETEVELRMTRR